MNYKYFKYAESVLKCDGIIEAARRLGSINNQDIRYIEEFDLSISDLIDLNNYRNRFKSNNINLYSYELIKTGEHDETRYLDYKFKYNLCIDCIIDSNYLCELLEQNCKSWFSVVLQVNGIRKIRFENQEDYLLANLSNLYVNVTGFVKDGI